MKNSVMLVTEDDQMFGTMDKLAAHRSGALHRAVSVFIFNTKGEMLLQQRATGKYHSGGLWSNACCSHPYLGESVKGAAIRRLNEEMGIATTLSYAFHFHYKEVVTGGLTEHELDHVFIGISDAIPVINPAEVSDYYYLPIPVLGIDLEKHPENYTKWFRICFARIVEFYHQFAGFTANLNQ